MSTTADGTGAPGTLHRVVWPAAVVVVYLAAVVRLASQGIGVTPGTPFALLPSAQDHIRVTVGLLPDRHAEVAAQLAAAANTAGWRAGAR